MTNTNKNRSAFIASLDLDASTIQLVTAIWTKYETGIHESIKIHGKRYALERYKESYKFLRNRTLQLPTQPIPFCKVDKRGIPKPLWPLRPFLKGDRILSRVALTIARSYELITLEIDYSTDSITGAPQYGDTFDETRKDFNKFLTKFVQKYDWYLGSLQTRSGLEPRVFTTLSKGPNGPAISCAHLDAQAVVSDAKLFKALTELNSKLNQSWITDWALKQAQSYISEETYLTGRLGFTAEPAGKTRVFAIGDYWSQTSLKVIQDSLYNTLRKISTDATANQDKGFKTLMEESRGKPTYCFDLSSASDRIPAVMQVHRLNLMSGNNVGDAWLKVMTERTFYIKATKQNVRWSVGQPLGLLSSFPSFALWHHDIIQYAYNIDRIKRNKPLKFFHDYRLLGDDVVIFNKKVAQRYQFLITEVFGIPINLSKSVIGDSRKNQIEFTKRLALDGLEMSSIKRNILTKDSICNMLDLIDILLERDFISRDTSRYGPYHFLSSKEDKEFRFMLWVRSHDPLPFKGDVGSAEISREDFNELLKSKRAQNISDKTFEVDRILSENKPVEDLFNSNSLPYNERALGYNQDGYMLHPLVWAINQTGLDLSIALSTIWDEQDPDVAPVEYLPIVSNKSYFSKPNSAKREYLSKLILDVYTELRKES
jgi:hypothetical protein